MEKGPFGFEVRVHGRTVKEYTHDRQTWIEGRKGSDFTLRICNNSRGRVLAVLSVDGLSVMSGETASFNSGGYILSPGQHYDIPGWRLTDDEVAKFKFHKPARSYAAKTDRPANIGVIGCAYFREKPKPRRPLVRSSARRRGAGAQNFSKGITEDSGTQPDSYNFISDVEPAGEAAGEYSTKGSLRSAECNAGPSLGTEFGKKAEHRVVSTTFEPASDIPTTTMEIRYGDRADLDRRGINRDQRPVAANRPTSFPAENGCKPPAGWQG